VLGDYEAENGWSCEGITERERLKGKLGARS